MLRSLARLFPVVISSILLAGCGGTAATSAPPASSAVAKPSQAGGSAAVKTGSAPASAGASAAATGQKLNLKSAYTTTSATMAPLWGAKEAAAFDEQGLDVSISRIEAGAPILAAMQGGDVPLAFVGAQQIVEADLKGAEFVIVAGFTDKLSQQIYVINSIQTPEQLRGKALGVTNFGAITHVAGRVAAEQMGLKGQVNFIATGGPPETIAAVQVGKVQGGVFSPPQSFLAEKQGLHMLFDLAKTDIKSQGTAIATTRKYASEHPDVVDRFIRAALTGSHRIITDRQAGLAAIKKYGGVDDPELVEKTYDYYKDQWSKDGVPSVQGIQQNLDVAADTIPEAKNAKPEQFIDLKFINAIKASGFIDKLWAAKT